LKIICNIKWKIYFIKVYILFAHILSPVNSDPPVVVGGDQLRVTLLLVTFVARTFSGHEGGAEENLNYYLLNIYTCLAILEFIYNYVLQLFSDIFSEIDWMH